MTQADFDAFDLNNFLSFENDEGERVEFTWEMYLGKVEIKQAMRNFFEQPTSLKSQEVLSFLEDLGIHL